MKYIQEATCRHCRTPIERICATGDQKGTWRHSGTHETRCPRPLTSAEPKEYT